MANYYVDVNNSYNLNDFHNIKKPLLTSNYVNAEHVIN
jgi:hypothetical protein